MNGTTYLEMMGQLLDVIDTPTINRTKLSQMIFNIRRVLSEDLSFITDGQEETIRSVTLEKRIDSQITEVINIYVSQL